VHYAPEFLDELRSRVGLAELIGRSIKLQRRGREYAGLCPFHQERTPSFYIVEDEGFFHCFGCGAHGDAIGFVMRADHVDFHSAVAKLAAEVVTGTLRAERALPPNNQVAVELRDNEQRNRRIAWRLWDHAKEARGTLVEKYLRSRGLSLPPAPVLRFAPRCWNRETGRELPAMVARVDDVHGNFIALHRTWLLPDGSGKAELEEPKWSLGPIRGGAVRLAPEGPVLAIAEGIEDALSAIAAKGIPAWSAVSKGGFKTVRLPGEVGEVLIVADHDKNSEGELAARAAGERWAAEGRRARLRLSSRLGEDANKLLLKEGEKDDVARGALEGTRPG
jgi:hypothetical protein